MLVLPIASSPYFTQTATLDGEPYRFTFALSYRYQRYSMTISDRAGVTLLAGIPLVINRGLIHKFPGRNLPPGELMIVRRDGKLIDPAPEKFVSVAQLIYITEAEYAAL